MSERGRSHAFCQDEQYSKRKYNKQGLGEGAWEVRVAMVLRARESRAQEDGTAVMMPLEGRRWQDRQSPLN